MSERRENGSWGRLTQLAVWALGVIPLAALGDQPSASTSVLGAGPPDSVLSASAGSSSSSDSQLHNGKHRPTDEEWREAADFLQQYTPKRLAALNQLADGPLKQRVKNFIYGRYVAIMRAKENFPEIYQLQVKRLMIEDNIFATHRQMLAASTVARPAIRMQLKQQVAELFDNVQQERQVRIDRLKQWANDLQHTKENDDQNREAVISRQVQEVMKFGPYSLMHDGMQRRGTGPGAGETTEDQSVLRPPTTQPSE